MKTGPEKSGQSRSFLQVIMIINPAIKKCNKYLGWGEGLKNGTKLRGKLKFTNRLTEN